MRRLKRAAVCDLSSILEYRSATGKAVALSIAVAMASAFLTVSNSVLLVYHSLPEIDEQFLNNEQKMSSSGDIFMQDTHL